MFGLEYTRVQIPVQLVSKQRNVDSPHKKNRPGVTIQQLKSMAKRSRQVGVGAEFDCSFKNGQGPC